MSLALDMSSKTQTNSLSNTQREEPFMEAKDDPIPHFRK